MLRVHTSLVNGVKEFCLSQCFPDTASGFQLPSKLRVWFIRALGRSSDLTEFSQQVEHSTGFELRFHLVCKLPLSCLDASHPSTLLLSANFTANKLTKPSSQPGYKQVFFLPFIQHTLNLVDSVKLQSVLKLYFECPRVGEQYPRKSPFCDPLSPPSILTETH